MMNVSDGKVETSNFDFEEFNSKEFDSWINSRSLSFPTDDEMNGRGSLDSLSSSSSEVGSGIIASIFAQSIDMIGSAVAPWPSRKPSVSEEPISTGIFMKSESPKEPESSQRSLSRLRRSNSGRQKRFSLSRINEDELLNSKQLYSEMEPIPIVSAPKKEQRIVAHKEEEQEIVFGRDRKSSSRFHSWISAFYSRASTINSSADEESAITGKRSQKHPLLKGILKSQSKGTIQKSVVIPENEAMKLTTSAAGTQSYVKKTIKIRFDNEVCVCETFNKEDYCRQSLDYVARQLTPSLALAIKKELNGVKQEMEVHEDSRHFTQFYLLK